MAMNDIGIDLGTTSVIVALEGKGVILNEPSVVAVDHRHDDKVLAVGSEAFAMVGRTPAYISAERPLKDGVISNHVLTKKMIQQFVNRVYDSRVIKPRVAVCVPAAITGIESDAVVEAVVSAGARQVFLIDEPIAAALGSGIDITQPKGHMFIDLVRQKFSLVIGLRTAEELKKAVACCPQRKFSESMEVKGRSLITNLPQRQIVKTEDLYEPVMRCVEQLGVAAHQVLERTPPELAGDIYSEGVVLTGGVAQLKGLAEYFREKLKVDVRVADDPVNCVAMGTARSLSMGDQLETGFYDATPRVGHRR